MIYTVEIQETCVYQIEIYAGDKSEAEKLAVEYARNGELVREVSDRQVQVLRKRKNHA